MGSVDAGGPPGPVRATVAYSPGPREVDQVVLQLPAGSTLADAVRASGLLQRHGLPADAPVGVWGKPKPGDTPLRADDRVEIYRGLQVDPKEARRQRYRAQRPRAARSSGS
ncbi:RnfH family protein [Ideonella sp.]|uniref:RnfH family protein n=1 Tax=Ideonella sp. TaxID=1929293 RepID=UPI0035B0CBC3